MNTDKLTVEGNKIIHEFKGETPFPEKPNDNHAIWYNRDWNLLMSVVEKIEAMGYIVIIERRSCYIQSHDTRSVISTAQFFDSKIKTVYTAVTSFVEWYTLQLNNKNS